MLATLIEQSKVPNDTHFGEYGEDPFPLFTNVPALPRVAALTDAELQGAELAGRWIDDYTTFAIKASPMTPRLFHETFALGMLSTAVARRLNLRVGKTTIYPNLYALLIAPSTLYAKTTGLNLATDLLKMAGMSHLTMPTGVTPQSLVSELSHRTPQTFGDWSQDDKDDWQQERPFAAQRAWWMDEAAGLLDLFKQKHTSELLSLILKLYDCPEKMPASTIGRGRETIRRAYLTITGPTTPAAMRQHLKTQELWGDGLFARFLLVTPNAHPVRAFFTDEIFETPPALAKHLNTLAFLRLPMPKDDQPPTPIRVEYSPEVFQRWSKYHEGTWDLVNKRAIPEKLFSCYGRLPTNAIKIAMLLAASDWVDMAEGNPLVIRLEHWARAQLMTEEYRASLHRLVDDASNPRESEEQDFVEKIVSFVRQRPGRTRAEIARQFHITAGTSTRSQLDDILLQLLKDGEFSEKVIKQKSGPSRNELYHRSTTTTVVSK